MIYLKEKYQISRVLYFGGVEIHDFKYDYLHNGTVPIDELEKYWMNVTKVPKRLFYKSRIDPRTIGKPTRKKEYKGVLKIDYFDSKVQHDLESLENLMYNFVGNKGL